MATRVVLSEPQAERAPARLRAAAASLDTAEWIALGLLLGAAFLLRAVGAWFGLPHVLRADEGAEVYRAVRLGMGGFDYVRVQEGGYYFLLFLEYAAYFLVEFVTRSVSGVGEFAARFAADPSPFWRIGRVTTALLGTATVALLWFQGRRAGGSRVGWMAALFLAVSALHVIHSHYVTVDVPAAFWALLALTMTVEASAGRSRLRPLAWAFVAGYAALHQQRIAVLLVPLLLAAWMQGGWSRPGGIRSRATLTAAGAAAVLYGLANPGLFTAPVVPASHLLQRLSSSVDPELDFVALGGTARNLWLFHAGALLRSQGPALLALAGLGAVFGIRDRNRGVLLHLAFVIPFLIVLAGSGIDRPHFPRHVVPLLPSLCFLAAVGLDAAVRRLSLRPVAATALALVVAGLAAAEPARTALRWDQRMTRPDTRALAAAWVEENIPHKTSVLLEGSAEDPTQLSIPLRNLRRNVKAMIRDVRATDPGKARFWETRLATLQPPLYDLRAVRHSDAWPALGETLEQGIAYVVLRREFFLTGTALSGRLPSAAVESRAAFYEQLLGFPGASLAASFDASPSGNPGYDLEIWRLPGADAAPADDEGEE